MKINFINKDKLKKIGGIVLVGSMLATPVIGSAQSYTIQPGDNLMSISQRFYGRSDYYDEIAFLNGIENPSLIRAGDVIYLPDNSRELEFCGQDENWVDVNTNIIYYTFGPKDTLWNLAFNYYGDGRYWKCLAAYNGITNPKKIRDGKVIMIPPFANLNMDALNWTFEGSENTNTDTVDEVKTRTRTFEEGDTLWAYASEYYGSGNWWTELAIYNGIDNPRKIANGTTIYLPEKSVLKNIREGNYAKDLWTISKETYGSSRYAGVIAALNNISNYGSFNAKDLFLPSLQDINVYYESDTFTYQTDGYYVVQKGDSLVKISELVYDDPSFAEYLKEINGIDKLVEGMAIYIPSVETYTK